jgi:hypothetical protein
MGVTCTWSPTSVDSPRTAAPSCTRGRSSVTTPRARSMPPRLGRSSTSRRSTRRHAASSAPCSTGVISTWCLLSNGTVAWSRGSTRRVRRRCRKLRRLLPLIRQRRGARPFVPRQAQEVSVDSCFSSRRSALIGGLLLGAMRTIGGNRRMHGLAAPRFRGGHSLVVDSRRRALGQTPPDAPRRLRTRGTRPSMKTSSSTSSHPRPHGLAWLTVDWASLIVAVVLAALVRAGVIEGVPW